MTPLIRETIAWTTRAGMDPTELQWFDISALIAAAEREACAKLLEDFDRFGDTRDCIAAIRARGEKGGA